MGCGGSKTNAAAAPVNPIADGEGEKSAAAPAEDQVAVEAVKAPTLADGPTTDAEKPVESSSVNVVIEGTAKGAEMVVEGTAEVAKDAVEAVLPEDKAKSVVNTIKEVEENVTKNIDLAKETLESKALEMEEKIEGSAGLCKCCAQGS